MPRSPCSDHLGNNFQSQREMCNYHGVDYMVYKSRSGNHRGWPIEWKLFGKEDGDNASIVDHLGNVFDTYTELCKFHGVDRG
jgi:hypothetical protein